MLAGSPVAAQMQRVPTDLRFAKTPGGQVLGTLAAGAQVSTGRTDGESTEVTLEGWVITSSVDPTNREGFDLIITERPTENLRQVPNGPVIARLSSGVLLSKLGTQGGWTRVRRTGWVARNGLGSAPAPLASTSSGTPSSDQIEVIRSTQLTQIAGGAGVGSLDSGARGRILGKAGEWSRVQLEAWVRDSDLRPATGDIMVGVSQAEVRANPSRFVGKTVEWRVQFISIQKADELRPEIPAGQSYLLTRGPLPEPGFVYVIVPASQLETFRAVPALQELTIRATIKSATTKYLPTPVVELLNVVKGLGS
jgi:hypothetical protein